MLKVRINEVDFHGHTDLGFLIGPGGFVGWEGSPATRREGIDLPLGHGSFRSQSFKSGRLLRLSGTALASSEGELASMGDVLSGLGASPSRVTVTTDAGTRWADGSVEGEVRFDRVGGARDADFGFTLWFENPRQFGAVNAWTVLANRPSSMRHDGNFPAHPRFIVRGPQPSGYSITATGKPSFQVNAPLASGSTDVVDFATGRVHRNGVLLVGGVSFPRTWSVPGGAEQSWSFAGTGSGTCTAELTDTFI